METLQALASQLHFSLTMSQVIVSFGILALGALWGRMKVGITLFLGTFAYWEYAANKAVLFQIAAANAYGIFMTMFVGLFMGFLLVYAWVLPSSR
jgi:hypothetical protein